MTQSPATVLAPPERDLSLRARGLPQVSARVARSTGLKLLYVLWFAVAFDPHWYLSQYVGMAVLKVVAPFHFIVLAFALKRFPPRTWYWPCLVFLFGAMAPIPFAQNIGYAENSTRQFVLQYVLLLSTVLLVRRLRDVTPILLILLGSFLWFAVLGDRRGIVEWHPVLGDPDGYGPAMVLGMGFSYYLAMASRDTRWRRLALATAGLCLVGVIMSFARGAVLATAALVFVMWLRSPRKARALGAIFVGGVITLVATKVLFPNGAFWREINSTFEEGTTEGTAADRIELWKAAVTVFKESPVFGVGGRNFGPTAAAIIQKGEVGGRYGANPLQLYDRSLHSIYFQTLAERGLVGVFVFAFLVVDFWKRNRRLRSPQARALWNAETGGKLELRFVSLALEAMMVAYLMNGLFYPLTEIHWMWTIVTVNLILSLLIDSGLRAWRRAGQTGAHSAT